MDIRKLTVAMAASLLSGLGAAAQGQGVPEWERLAIPDATAWQDWSTTSEAPGAATGPLLAVDGGGRIYVNNGPKLHIGYQGGNTWTTLAKPPEDPLANPWRPLAAGALATVRWGEWRSRDGGATWDSTAEERPYAFGVLKDGSTLRSRPATVIERSAGGVGDWDLRHAGMPNEHVSRFVVGEAGAVFALPQADTLLCSIDSGKTWDWGRRAWPMGTELSGRTIRALDFGSRMGTPLLIAARRNGDGTGNLLLRLHVFYTSLDTLDEAILPDSAITALHLGGDGTIWLGTNGQGVWKAGPGSLHFTACNEGLGDMHAASLATTADGRLFVLTRDGVYRARYEAVATHPVRPSLVSRPPGGRGAGIALILPGLPGSRQPFIGGAQVPRLRVLADGRMVGSPADGANRKFAARRIGGLSVIGDGTP